MEKIEIRELNTWYGKFHALKDVSFEIPRGRVAGLLGPNGAGKTTLIKSMLGIIPCSGEIRFFGKEKRNRDVGYLSEDEGYYEWMTAYDYLLYFAKIYDVEEQRIEEILKEVGLYDRRFSKISEFSKGMKRRVGIARALLHEPDIVIMDEPLSGLDPLIKKEIKEIIKKFTKEGRTFLISSHQLRDIDDICDWLILIKDGEIINYDEPGEIMQKLKPEREIVFTVEGDIKKLEKLRGVDGVENVEINRNVVTVRFSGDDDSRIFKFLIDEGIKFNLKGDSLDSVYRRAFK